MPLAAVPILHRWEEGGRQWLLLRRSLTDPQEKAYYARLWTVWTHPGADGHRDRSAASISRKILPTPKIWVWITTRCAASSHGIAI